MPELSKKFRYLLFPLALFYWGVLFWRNLFYTVGFFVTGRLPVPVISVGNLSVGGTGKTPMVIYLARELQQMGKKVAIVSRGYRRKSVGTLVVSDGKSIHASVEEAGDEPYLMARRLPSVPVVVDEDRYRGGLFAVEKFDPTVIVLDDAFQHRQVERDIDIVLLNSHDPPEAYKLLPYGKLREPWFHLRRADIVFWTKSNLGQPQTTIKTRALQSKVPAFTSRMVASHVLRGTGGKTLSTSRIRRKRVFAFCGIADPMSFRKLLEGIGVDIVRFEVFEDHHEYSRENVKRMMQDGKEVGAEHYITTDKDFVKVSEVMRGSGMIYSLGVRFVPSREGKRVLWQMIERKLRMKAKPVGSENPHERS